MSDRSRRRLAVLNVLVLSLVVTLFGRLWYLQVLAADQFQQAATDNRTREVRTPAVRGIVLDDRGRPLVRNRTAMVVSISRTELLDLGEERARELVARVAEVIDEPFEDVWGRTRLCGTEDAPASPVCWNGSPFQPIPVTEDADMDMALQIVEHREDFPGVTAELAPIREFPLPEGALATHLLGYVGPVTDADLARQAENATGGTGGRADTPGTLLQGTDAIGKSGLEQHYDAELRGTPGVRTVAVDSRNRVEGTLAETSPVPGNYLVTHLDAEVQAVAERELQSVIDSARGEGLPAHTGAVVVLDHQTGGVVAMASYPSYDPNVWVGGIDPADYAEITSEENRYPNQSRAFQGEFAPASTFKVVTTTAAVNVGYSLDATYPCTAAYQVGDQSFRNLESRPYGPITLKRALQVSCNTVFYKFGHEMWQRDGGNDPDEDAAEVLVSTARGYGFGTPTGVDLPGEADGLIADRAFKEARWERNKERWCTWAEEGYPDDQGGIDAYLTQLMVENCADGYKVRAGDAVNASIGQGETLVTPLQMAVAYGAIANGGTVWEPRVAKAVMSPAGEVVREIEAPVAGAVPASPETLAYLQDALRSVSTDGTAAGVFAGWPHEQIPVGAKTGSGQVSRDRETTSWFASFTDRYAVVMMVEEGGSGSGTSGPGVRAIYDAIYGVAEDGTVDPQAAILPGGLPPQELPTITPDGMVVAPDSREMAPASREVPPAADVTAGRGP